MNLIIIVKKKKMIWVTHFMILMQFYNLEVIKNKEIRILKIAIINFKTCKIINKFTGSRHLEFLKYSYK